MIIDWNDEFLIGLPQLDADHRALVRRINEVAETVSAGRSEAPVLLAAWIDLFCRHAESEEELLDRLALPAGRAHTAEHRAGHRRFLTRAEAVHRRLVEGLPCDDDFQRLGDQLMIAELIRADFDMVGHLRREGLLLPDGSLLAAHCR